MQRREGNSKKPVRLAEKVKAAKNSDLDGFLEVTLPEKKQTT